MEPAASAQQRHRQLAKLFMAFTKIFQPTLNILLFVAFTAFMKEPQPTLIMILFHRAHEENFLPTNLDLDALHRVLADCRPCNTHRACSLEHTRVARPCAKKTRRALPGTGGHFQREAMLPTGGKTHAQGKALTSLMSLWRRRYYADSNSVSVWLSCVLS